MFRSNGTLSPRDADYQALRQGSFADYRLAVRGLVAQPVEFSLAQRAAVRAGAAVRIGCDHTHYPAHVIVSAETLASLAGDLR